MPIGHHIFDRWALGDATRMINYECETNLQGQDTHRPLQILEFTRVVETRYVFLVPFSTQNASCNFGCLEKAFMKWM